MRKITGGNNFFTFHFSLFTPFLYLCTRYEEIVLDYNNDMPVGRVRTIVRGDEAHHKGAATEDGP